MRATNRAFSLVELLVVVTLLAGLAGAVARVALGSGSTDLEAAQAQLVHLLEAARSRAVAAQAPARLLVHVDAVAPAARERLLRRVLVQERRQGDWRTVIGVSLPRNARLLPGNQPAPAGLLAGPAEEWVRGDGSPLRSTALRANFAVAAREDDGPPESWIALTLSEHGTTFSTGDLVVARVRFRAGAPVGAQAPFEFHRPDQVRGASVSSYGVALLLHDRTSF